jgi:hypothetical protein
VFYDGPALWTAELNFRDRVLVPHVFKKYIPTFEYELVKLNKYRQEDLIEFADVLSFIMLIDTLKPKEGIEALQGLPQEYLEELWLKIPESMGKLIIDVITVLLSRLGVSREGIGTVTDMIEKKEDRTMFEVFVENVLEDKRLAVQQEREE